MRIVLALVGLIGLYLFFNFISTHKLRKLDSRELDRYVAAVNDSSANPFRFIADKFNTHSIIFLGELHKREQDLRFFRELIGYLYREKHITIIGWEFGSVIDQKEADSLVNAATFDRKKAIGILRKNYYAWCYEEYLNVFEEVWKINREIKNDKDKIRFLQLNQPYIPRRLFHRSTAFAIKNRNSIWITSCRTS